MTEKDLYTYKDAKKRKEAALMRLREFESALYSPKSQVLDGMPFNACKVFSDALPQSFDEHQRLIDDVNRCNAEILKAWIKLNKVAKILSDEEAVFFDLRYRSGEPIHKIIDIMHRSNRSIFRIRKSIIGKIDKIR